MSSDEIGELLDELQQRLDRCKVLYEQYFLGIQRTPPGQLHRELERRIRQLTQTHIRNTGVRFRFTTLSQKFASYNTYWKRTIRQIESGTYVRDMARVGRDAIRNGKDIPEELLAKMPKRMRERIIKERENVAQRARLVEDRERALRDSGKVRDNRPGNVHQLDDADLLEDLDLDSIFAGMTSGQDKGPSVAAAAPAPRKAAPKPSADDTDVEQLFGGAFSEQNMRESAPVQRVPVAPPQRPAPRPAPPPPRRPPPPRASVKPPPGMSEQDAQALYKSYKKARELVGENTSNLSYDRLMNSLNKQAPKILKQHQATGVSFNVVVKGDRVVLKAKPKK